MSVNIEKEKVRELVDHGAWLVEVLPADAYRQVHIAGAISLPLSELDRDTAARLEATEPVIVYCYDYQ